MAVAVPSPLERGNYLTVARQRQPSRRVETRLASRVKRDDVPRLHRRDDDGGGPPRLNLIYAPRSKNIPRAARDGASGSTGQSAGRHFAASGRPSNALTQASVRDQLQSIGSSETGNRIGRPISRSKQPRAADRLPSVRSVADRFRASTRARTRVSRDR